MKSKFLVLALLFTMSGASLGSAAPAPPPPVPALDLPALELSVATSTPATPSCAKNGATEDQPGPQWLSGSDQYCGICSVTPCALGVPRFSRCGYGGSGRCDYTDNFCEEDWIPVCECKGAIEP